MNLEKFENSCNKIVNRFCKKQELEFDYWIADEIGEMASFGLIYFFSLEDMIFDLSTEQRKGMILEWQDYLLSQSNLCQNFDLKKTISYKEYIKGKRYENNQQTKN